jgi:hypothetical protein
MPRLFGSGDIKLAVMRHLERLPVPDERADLVLFQEAIENLENPLAALRELNRVLARLAGFRLARLHPVKASVTSLLPRLTLPAIVPANRAAPDGSRVRTPFRTSAGSARPTGRIRGGSGTFRDGRRRHGACAGSRREVER